jgi:hypothetical protein
MSDREWNPGQGDDAENRVGAGMPNDTSDASHPPGNRPAQGAAQVQNTNQLQTGWQGGAGATDFLGLEPDLRGPSVFASPQAHSNASSTASGTAASNGESWLLSVEDAEQSAPTNFASAPMSSAHAPTDIATAAENALDFGADAEGDPAADEIEPIVLAAPRTSSMPRWIAIAAGVCALAAGGWYFQHWRTTHRVPVQTDVPVATKPTAKPAKGPKVATKAPTGNPARTEPAPAPADPTSATLPTTAPDTTTAKVDDPSLPVQSNPGVTEPVATTVPDPSPPVAADPALIAALDNVPPSAVDAAPTAITPPDRVTTRFAPGGLPVLPAFEGALAVRRHPIPTASSLVSTPATPPGAVRKATSEDFANLWREPTIPTAAIRGETRLRTLNVGRVRALLQDGEYFEGALYAVGEGRIWLELDLGRISFEASVVRELTQIRGGEQRVGKADPNGDLAGLPHVEVRVPGGIFIGRLIARTDDRVTLVTDAGLRLVVESDDVRPVSQTSTRVVGTVEGAVRTEQKPVNTLEKMSAAANKKPVPAPAEKPKKPLKKP